MQEINFCTEEIIKEIDNIYGLDECKETIINYNTYINLNGQLKQIVNYVKVNRNRRRLPMLHMCFMGNPGVGKTEVARIVGKIFAEENILSDKEIFIEAQRSDLIAEYVGQTAIKTKNLIQRATDGVLFIDEAYSLVP